ncbi:MAG: AmmeMemoRadiSam system protein B [Methanoregula sp.]|jgi:hypothetical protein
MKMRPCAVAGMFYPRDPSHLEQLLATFFSAAHTGGDSLGIVSPHAGYIYSGQVAAQAFSAIAPGFSGTFVIIGPSHKGYISCVSAIPWETPLGVVETDAEFVHALDMETDELSQEGEHSIEVQVPFIKYRFPRARIAPIMMGSQDISDVGQVAGRIVGAIKKTGRDVRIVASSDFSHYVPEIKAKTDDLYAIEALNTLNVTEFYRRIEARGVSACGYGPIAVMVTVAQELGATAAHLIRYATSGDATGDHSSVVGYAAIAVM